MNLYEDKDIYKNTNLWINIVLEVQCRCWPIYLPDIEALRNINFTVKVKLRQSTEPHDMPQMLVIELESPILGAILNR